MPSAAEPPACAICGKPAQGQFSPFCSRRCADIDLGRWLKGSYAIPGPPAEEAGESPQTPPDPDQAPDT
jgi:uncharacterized protein